MSILAAPSVTNTLIEQELERMFREHYQLLYRTAYSMLNNRADAEDVRQTLFLKLLRRGMPPDLKTNARRYLGGRRTTDQSEGKATVQQFAEEFDPYEVFDKTGLKGLHAFNFTFIIPGPLPPGADAPGGGRGGGTPAPGSSPRIRALQSALRDQLGLQLEFGNVPVDVVIVGHAEKPSEN
jgi:uncharacterized protein (TIGR03435 family)